MSSLSPRLREIVDSLPLRPGQRVGHVLAVDRSAKAIEQLMTSASDLIASGLLSVRNVSCEELVLEPARHATTSSSR